MTTAQSEQAATSAKLIVPFVRSLCSVFTTMVKTEATVGKPTLKATPGLTYDVSGIIGFSGDLMGSVVVSFQMETAQKLVESFAGCPVEPGSPDFGDAIGELANMIAGGAKKDLGQKASISTPTVVIGSGHTIARLSDVPCIVIPCTTPVGKFAVEVNVKQVAAA